MVSGASLGGGRKGLGLGDRADSGGHGDPGGAQSGARRNRRPSRSFNICFVEDGAECVVSAGFSSLPPHCLSRVLSARQTHNIIHPRATAMAMGPPVIIAWRSCRRRLDPAGLSARWSGRAPSMSVVSAPHHRRPPAIRRGHRPEAMSFRSGVPIRLLAVAITAAARLNGAPRRPLPRRLRLGWPDYARRGC